MKMLLAIAPPFWPKMPPIGIGCLQAFLENNSILCDIIDLNNIFYNLSSSELKRSWLISCNACMENNIFDLIQKNHPEELKKLADRMIGYEIIGFSCFKSNMNSTLKLIRLLKSKNNNIKIIAGGPEITRQFFKTSGRFTQEIKSQVDFIVTGEGEKPLLNIAQLRRLPEYQPAFNELNNLNTLALPIYRGLDINSYPRKNSISILSSRGCVRRCGFCSERLLYKKFRQRPAKNIIEEIRYYRSMHKTEYFAGLCLNF